MLIVIFIPLKIAVQVVSHVGRLCHARSVVKLGVPVDNPPGFHTVTSRPQSMFSQSRTRTLFLVTSVLIILMAGRILHLGVAIQEFHADEVWSVWQLIGSHTGYTRDAKWPPLYYMMLDGWWRVAGLQPIALRMLSPFIFLLGAVSLNRAIRRTRTESAPLPPAAASGRLGRNGCGGRGGGAYASVYGVLPTSLWLTTG